MDEEKNARAVLSLCPAMGPVRFRRLAEVFGSAAGALSAGVEAWAGVEGVGAVAAETLSKEIPAARRRWEADARALEKGGVRVVIPAEPSYPESLKSLDDAPFILYIEGELKPLDGLSVALVGSRQPTSYGRAVTERLARELAEAGVTVVSGLARGIDSEAHAAVVKAKGRTVGVLGSGFGHFYPAENRALARKMAENGAVITEYPWSMEPHPSNFPRRNRIIAGASLAVVVVEAGVKSGALITARLAAEQGREVFAVPGSIFSPMSLGPHRLLKEGVRPVEDAHDVLESLEVFRGLLRAATPAPRASPAALTPPESGLLEKISLDPVGVDALSSATGMGSGALASALLSLELKGLVKALPGKSYVRTEAALKG